MSGRPWPFDRPFRSRSAGNSAFSARGNSGTAGRSVLLKRMLLQHRHRLLVASGDEKRRGRRRALLSASNLATKVLCSRWGSHSFKEFAWRKVITLFSNFSNVAQRRLRRTGRFAVWTGRREERQRRPPSCLEKPSFVAPVGRPTLSARRDLGRARRQLRPVLGQRHQGRALPVRRRAASARSSASPCRSTPTKSGTATCPMRGRARSTAIACMVPTSQRPATASIPTSCCSIPTPSR